jgi:hypothetical protein
MENYLSNRNLVVARRSLLAYPTNKDAVPCALLDKRPLHQGLADTAIAIVCLTITLFTRKAKRHSPATLRSLAPPALDRDCIFW